VSSAPTNFNSEYRHHPDLFTSREAAEYLHLQPEQTSTIETLRETGALAGAKIGKAYFYHRRDLDALVLSLFNRRADDGTAAETAPPRPAREASQTERTAHIRAAQSTQPARGPKLKFNGVAVAENA